MQFVDLFAGIGGFYRALTALGHECVFACEKDEELRELYIANYSDMRKITFGDIRDCKDKVPQHDILCAGFPCQPFSKSRPYNGTPNTQGTVFDDIRMIIDKHKPQYILMENVGNFQCHDEGRTWATVKQTLQNLGYEVAGTEHIKSGGPGLLSPHHFGYPQLRGRFYIVASRQSLPAQIFPVRKPLPQCDSHIVSPLAQIAQANEELSEETLAEVTLHPHRIECINHWNSLIQRLPHQVSLPSFPIWSEEFGAQYPYDEVTPYYADIDLLRTSLNGHAPHEEVSREALLALIPSYARRKNERFPDWKKRYIRQNREWYEQWKEYFPDQWLLTTRSFFSSHRKLEWNCQGAERDLWQHMLQFRPSGLRVRRFTMSPALVAMTDVQVPILGPYRRFMTRVEGLRLQGFPDDHELPKHRERAFRALGNAVHVKVAMHVACALLQQPLPQELEAYNTLVDNPTVDEEAVQLPLLSLNEEPSQNGKHALAMVSSEGSLSTVPQIDAALSEREAV